jgi:hypothetical protein
MPTIPTLRRMRQGDHGFKASLDYIMTKDKNSPNRKEKKQTKDQADFQEG